jgi:hypothetical protein
MKGEEAYFEMIMEMGMAAWLKRMIKLPSIKALETANICMTPENSARH